MAAAQPERILVVEHDPENRDLIARQALQPLGYRVKTAELASTAIQLTPKFKPDVVITNLKLPDLSGKDLLIAFQSQGIDVPVILLAEEGKERDVLQAFRLGASDYLQCPPREAEVVAAVERALKSVRARKEREMLARQLKKTNRELERRVKELTTIFSIGKAVTSITHQGELLDRIMEGAVLVTETQRGWLLLKEERSGKFILRAHRNLPKSVARQLNRPFDDGLSSLVALSGTTLSAHGESLKRFKIARLGQAALVVPIKAKQEVIGLLVVVRKQPKPFDQSAQTLLEAVADYASISLINARLYQALEARAQKLQKAVEEVKKAEQVKGEILQNVSHELRTPLVAAKGYVDMMVDGQLGELTPEQKEAISITQEKLQRVVEIINVMTTLQEAIAPKHPTLVNLNKFVQRVVERFESAALRNNISLKADLPETPVFTMVDRDQIAQVFNHLLTNAIKFSPNGGEVTVKVEPGNKKYALVSIRDTGIGINKKHLSHIFDRFYQVDGTTTRRFGGLGIGLAVAKEIITAHGGKIWAESQPGKGSTFKFILPKF